MKSISRLTLNRSAFAAALCAGLMIAAPQFASAAPQGPGTEEGPQNFAGHDDRDGPDRHGGRHHGGPFMHELKSLDLSAAQKDSIHTAIKAHWDAVRSEQDTLHKLRRAVDTATPDSAGYTSLVNQLADAQANEARDRVQKQAALKSEVFAMLTPAQKTALSDKLKKLPEPPARPEKTGSRRH